MHQRHWSRKKLIWRKPVLWRSLARGHCEEPRSARVFGPPRIGARPGLRDRRVGSSATDRPERRLRPYHRSVGARCWAPKLSPVLLTSSPACPRDERTAERLTPIRGGHNTAPRAFCCLTASSASRTDLAPSVGSFSERLRDASTSRLPFGGIARIPRQQVSEFASKREVEPVGWSTMNRDF